MTSGSFDFDLKKLEHYVKILTNNYSVNLSKLDEHPEVQESYEIVSEKVESHKEQITNLILKQYRPLQILPETVGGFLFGCFQQTYGDIPPECSPLCSSGIQNGNVLVSEKCQNQIHIQYLDNAADVRFVKLGRSTSNRGYIFVNRDFIGFTTHEITYMRNHNLYKVEILTTIDSTHHTIIKMRDLNDLPIITKSSDGNLFVLSSESGGNSERGNSVGGATEGINFVGDENTMIYEVLAIIIVAIVYINYK
jgi:hypothetical protein